MALPLPKTSALQRLIYVSRACAPATPYRDTMVHDILKAAQRRNTGLGVTGALLLCRGWFVQALEGSPEAVDDVYAHLHDDPRHADVTVIAKAPVRSREFGGWSMCGRELSAADEAILDLLESDGGFDARALTGRSALTLLSKVRDLQMREAAPAKRPRRS